MWRMNAEVCALLSLLLFVIAAWTKCWRWWCGSARPTWWSSRGWAEPSTPTTTPCWAARASRWPSSKTRGWPTGWVESCSVSSSSTRLRPGNPASAPQRWRTYERDGNGRVQQPERIVMELWMWGRDGELPLIEWHGCRAEGRISAGFPGGWYQRGFT